MRNYLGLPQRIQWVASSGLVDQQPEHVHSEVIEIPMKFVLEILIDEKQAHIEMNMGRKYLIKPPKAIPPY